MYHTLEVVRRPVNGNMYVCIQLYHDSEYLDCVLTPQSDVETIAMYIDLMRERHKVANVRIATDIREVLKRYVMIPGYLALYSTPGELSRSYRKLNETDEDFKLLVEFLEDDVPEDTDELEVTEEEITTKKGRIIEWIRSLLKQTSTAVKNKVRLLFIKKPAKN